MGRHGIFKGGWRIQARERDRIYDMHAVLSKKCLCEGHGGFFKGAAKACVWYIHFLGGSSPSSVSCTSTVMPLRSILARLSVAGRDQLCVVPSSKAVS